MNSSWKPYQDITKAQMHLLISQMGYQGHITEQQVADAQELVNRGFLAQSFHTGKTVEAGDYLNVTDAGAEYRRQWQANYGKWLNS